MYPAHRTCACLRIHSWAAIVFLYAEPQDGMPAQQQYVSDVAAAVVVAEVAAFGGCSRVCFAVMAAVEGCSDGGCDTVKQSPVLLPLMKWVMTVVGKQGCRVAVGWHARVLADLWWKLGHPVCYEDILDKTWMAAV